MMPFSLEGNVSFKASKPVTQMGEQIKRHYACTLMISYNIDDERHLVTRFLHRDLDAGQEGPSYISRCQFLQVNTF